VLVNGRGRTLYAFTPEKGGKVVCTGSCATLWPPLTVPSGQTVRRSALVHPSLISTVADPSGGRIVTYAGYPLHTYAHDAVPGDVKGQGIGSQWYVISTGGTIITRKPSSSSTTTTSGGAY
jgi:predicted lipoprotein with Yx(FWY)xxD motif